MATTPDVQATQVTVPPVNVPPVKVPKYYRLKQDLQEMIDNGERGGALPTERELATRFDTSRTTVRQALAELVVEGKLERAQGRGTFISEPKLITLRQLTSFSEDLAERGARPRSEILAVSRVRADRQVAAALALATDGTAGELVACVERLRFADDAPIAHETAYLPGRLPRLRAELERHGSLYRTLREVYGIEIDAAEDSVETALASPVQAQLLGCDTGLPMLLVCRTAWDRDRRPVEFTRSVFRGDRFRFVARRQGTGPSPLDQRDAQL
jgi:GntR family transcriptional regulator